MQPRQAQSMRARVCTGARHIHGRSPPAPQTHQGAGLDLLKALQEKWISQHSGHKKDSPGPCVPGTCPPPSPRTRQPLPCARVTGAINLLPSSEQRNWGSSEVIRAARLEGGEGCQASQRPHRDLLGLTAPRSLQVGPPGPRPTGRCARGLWHKAVLGPRCCCCRPPKCEARGAPIPPVLLLFRLLL